MLILYIDHLADQIYSLSPNRVGRRTVGYLSTYNLPIALKQLVYWTQVCKTSIYKIPLLLSLNITWIFYHLTCCVLFMLNCVLFVICSVSGSPAVVKCRELLMLFHYSNSLPPQIITEHNDKSHSLLQSSLLHPKLDSAFYTAS